LSEAKIDKNRDADHSTIRRGRDAIGMIGFTSIISRERKGVKVR